MTSSFTVGGWGHDEPAERPPPLQLLPASKPRSKSSGSRASRSGVQKGAELVGSSDPVPLVSVDRQTHVAEVAPEVVHLHSGVVRVEKHGHEETHQSHKSQNAHDDGIKVSRKPGKHGKHSSKKKKSKSKKKKRSKHKKRDSDSDSETSESASASETSASETETSASESEASEQSDANEVPEPESAPAPAVAPQAAPAKGPAIAPHRAVTVDFKTKAYEVPDSVVENLMDVYGETDKDKTIRVVTWIAQSIFQLYSDPAAPDRRMYYWGPTERGAYETLVNDIDLPTSVRVRMKRDIEEFEQFLKGVPPAEKDGYIDLPQFNRQILAPNRPAASVAKELKRALRRTRVDHVCVYQDFATVVHNYACMLKKEEEYKRHGYSPADMQRKLDKLSAKVTKRLKEYDAFVVKLYWEIFYNGYNHSPPEVQETVLDRLRAVQAVMEEVLAETQALIGA